jgi:intracellular septation protein
MRWWGWRGKTMTDATVQPKRHINPLLKFALELGPLAVFFFVNSRLDIFQATAAFMAATLVALAASWVLTRRIAVMPLVSGVVVAVFGALTLYLHDDVFIKLKPTIINTLFGLVLLGGLAFGRSFMAVVFDEAFQLTKEGWRILTLRWGLFFLFLAVVNEIVWRTQTTDFWVAFKVWGMMPLSMGFALMQIGVLQRHGVEEK